jgi:hypothetical protein
MEYSTEPGAKAGGYSPQSRKNPGKAIDFSRFFDNFTPPLIGI